jgi:hypothetical protein
VQRSWDNGGAIVGVLEEYGNIRQSVLHHWVSFNRI